MLLIIPFNSFGKNCKGEFADAPRRYIGKGRGTPPSQKTFSPRMVLMLVFS